MEGSQKNTNHAIVPNNIISSSGLYKRSRLRKRAPEVVVQVVETKPKRTRKKVVKVVVEVRRTGRKRKLDMSDESKQKRQQIGENRAINIKQEEVLSTRPNQIISTTRIEVL